MRRKIAISIEGFIYDTRQHHTDGETPKPFDVLTFSDGRRKREGTECGRTIAQPFNWPKKLYRLHISIQLVVARMQ